MEVPQLDHIPYVSEVVRVAWPHNASYVASLQRDVRGERVGDCNFGYNTL